MATQENLAGQMAGRRIWGTGSIHPVKGGSAWRVSVSLGQREGRRVRREWQYSRRELAESKLREVQSTLSRGLPPEMALEMFPARRHPRRMTHVDAAKAVLARARALRWSDEQTARAMVAGLSSMRVRMGVTGPCVYCGEEFASTVDHIDPMGGDGLENVVSACLSCNASKGSRTPAQWKRSA